MEKLNAIKEQIDEGTYDVSVSYDDDGIAQLLNEEQADDLVKFIHAAPDVFDALVELERAMHNYVNGTENQVNEGKCLVAQNKALLAIRKYKG